MKVKSILREVRFSLIFSILLAVLSFSFLVQAIAANGKAGVDKKSFQKQGSKNVPGYVEGEVLVKFNKGVNLSTAKSTADSLSIDIKKHFRVISRVKGHEYMHLKSRSKTTREMLQELKKQPYVENASPNFRLYADATTPNDKKFRRLWGLHNTGQTGGTADIDMDAPEAWDKNTGSPGVIAAVIDSGIDYNHPDLAANLWVNPNEIKDGIDNDGNGYVDDIHGINAITGSGDPGDDNGHGTHCSGTIGAVGNNGIGIVGVNWNVKLMGTKFLDSGGSGTTSDAISCIDYVIEQKTTYGQNIVAINASFGGGEYTQVMKDAIDAAGAADIVFCAAAGNDGEDNDVIPHYPSSYSSSNIIAVTAVDHNGEQCFNYGATSVDIGAPGISILSTVPCVYSPQPGDIFYDDMESGTGKWITGGINNTWAVTTGQEGFEDPGFPVPSPPSFWSDSPGTDYVSDTDSWLMNSSDIDLSGYVGQDIYIGFGSALYIEDNYDYAYVEVSGDGGSTWTSLVEFAESNYAWQTGYSFLIPNTVKTPNFRFRFHFVSDYAYNCWGWLLDDIGIGTHTTCGYQSWDGTSMATPHVTGAAALVAAQYPSDTVEERIARILNNAVPLSSLEGKCVSCGLLNLGLSINPPASITVTSPNGGERLSAGDIYKIKWTSAYLVGNVKIRYSTDNGSNWHTVISSTVNDGVYSWRVPNVSSTQCRVRINDAADETPSDISDKVFSIFSPSLTVTSPNGGEMWEVGSTNDITWTTTDTVEDVKIELSTNNGESWSTVISSTSNDGVYSWKVPDSESSTSTLCLVRISEMSTAGPSDTSDAVFTIFKPTPPEISLSRSILNFCALNPGTFTGPQFIWLNNSGGGKLSWSSGSGAPWLKCTPGSGTDAGVLTVSADPTGLANGSYTGSITISDPGASNSPQTITVNLTVKNAAEDQAPFGEFATPIPGSKVCSSIPVTGWVLDDVEVKSVKIYNGSLYVGDAVFVESARPDVEQAYPGYPKNYQAGWGYMLLTNFLPNGGNGTYTLNATAVDSEGNQVTLGSKTIVCDNANAVKPFGAIDTPAQGGTAAGSGFINWGWVLTPQPKFVPTDGSTINVFVDGVNLGHPTYNIYRADIAELFPGYANSNGAVGYFILDTNAYTTGIHTIQWTAEDSGGNTDGIGSRYFINIRDTGGESTEFAVKHCSQDIPVPQIGDLNDLPIDRHHPVRIRKGPRQDIEAQEIYPGNDGWINIEIRELEMLELDFSNRMANNRQLYGGMMVGDHIRSLPVGTSLDPGKGKFYWQPGPGFIGEYRFVFIEKSLGGEFRKKVVKIVINPKF